MTTSPLERAADSFAAELARHRTGRGCPRATRRPDGLRPVLRQPRRGRRHRPTEDFARRAEAVLEASGAIWQRFREYDDLRHARAVTTPRAAPARAVAAPRHRPRRRAGTRHPHPHRRRLPLRDPPRAVQRRHRAGHPLPRPGRRRPLPERPRPLQPAPPGAPAHLRRAATAGPPLRRRRQSRSRCTGGPSTTGTRSRRSGCSSRTASGASRSTPATGSTRTASGGTSGAPGSSGRPLPTRHLAVRLDLPVALDPQVWGEGRLYVDRMAPGVPLVPVEIPRDRPPLAVRGDRGACPRGRGTRPGGGGTF